MIKVSCEINKDLLPLYFDDICSDDSRRLVEEHLNGCEECKVELEKIREEFNLSREYDEKSQNDLNVVKKISVFWKRSMLKSFIKGVVISVLLVLLVYLGDYCLFQWSVVDVPIDNVKVSKVSELENGEISVELEPQNEANWGAIKYERDEDGNLYMMAKRPIIQRHPQTLKQTTIFNVDSPERGGKLSELKALYYGNKEEKKLIWKKGMEFSNEIND